MKELIIFLGIWVIFMFFSIIFTSRKLGFLSTVPLFCGVIAYFSSKRIILLLLFFSLFLVYVISSNFVLKREET